MTVAELLALPVGTGLRRDVMKMTGRVVARDGNVLRVAWTGGQEAEISPEDERHELAELADTLEVVLAKAPKPADAPAIVETPRRRSGRK